ncbi:MAG TPA: hypothetical protein PKY73_18655, partial [Hyphomonas sp.]|nr:hypothetical protein [Hyphomonas sp.]
MRYLLAAEADKIQEFIFRSSRLREVVGASQLLSRFCNSSDGVLALADQYDGDVVVNDGGSFRVIFDGDNARENAIAFGADLSELYRLSLGGSLSVAEPAPLNGDFRQANDEAGKKLRQVKNRRLGVTAEPHMPYIAFCASCGMTLADIHGQLKGGKGEHRRNYYCEVCQTKAAERDRKPRAILDDFYAAYCTAIGDEQTSEANWPEDADDIARYDLRQQNYVAYLVADGNGMGQLFGRCDQTQIEKVSVGLTSGLHASLAKPAAAFRTSVPGQTNMVPLLPLILGGDDLFALIPAPYALDFARRFCLAWEDELTTLVENAGLQIGENTGQIPRPTVAAAVVICKSKYPYALAHRRAEQLLKEAKRHSKLLAAESGEHLSAVSFEVILGNRLAGDEDANDERRKAIQPTLRPYWVAKGELSTSATERGIDLRKLLAQRLALKDVPNKRLKEVRRQFERLPMDIHTTNRDKQLAEWTNKLEALLKRIDKKRRTDDQWRIVNPLRDALAALGQPRNDDSDGHNWREVKHGGKTPLAHGMLDLLEAWDFAQD